MGLYRLLVVSCLFLSVSGAPDKTPQPSPDLEVVYEHLPHHGRDSSSSSSTSTHTYPSTPTSSSGRTSSSASGDSVFLHSTLDSTRPVSTSRSSGSSVVSVSRVPLPSDSSSIRSSSGGSRDSSVEVVYQSSPHGGSISPGRTGSPLPALRGSPDGESSSSRSRTASSGSTSYSGGLYTTSESGSSSVASKSAPFAFCRYEVTFNLIFLLGKGSSSGHDSSVQYLGEVRRGPVTGTLPSSSGTSSPAGSGSPGVVQLSSGSSSPPASGSSSVVSASSSRSPTPGSLPSLPSVYGSPSSRDSSVQYLGEVQRTPPASLTGRGPPLTSTPTRPFQPLPSPGLSPIASRPPRPIFSGPSVPRAAVSRGVQTSPAAGPSGTSGIRTLQNGPAAGSSGNVNTRLLQRPSLPTPVDSVSGVAGIRTLPRPNLSNPVPTSNVDRTSGSGGVAGVAGTRRRPFITMQVVDSGAGGSSQGRTPVFNPADQGVGPITRASHLGPAATREFSGPVSPLSREPQRRISSRVDWSDSSVSSHSDGRGRPNRADRGPILTQARVPSSSSSSSSSAESSSNSNTWGTRSTADTFDSIIRHRGTPSVDSADSRADDFPQSGSETSLSSRSFGRDSQGHIAPVNSPNDLRPGDPHAEAGVARRASQVLWVAGVEDAIKARKRAEFLAEVRKRIEAIRRGEGPSAEARSNDRTSSTSSTDSAISVNKRKGQSSSSIPSFTSSDGTLGVFSSSSGGISDSGSKTGASISNAGKTPDRSDLSSAPRPESPDSSSSSQSSIFPLGRKPARPLSPSSSGSSLAPDSENSGSSILSSTSSGQGLRRLARPHSSTSSDDGSKSSRGSPSKRQRLDLDLSSSSSSSGSGSDRRSRPRTSSGTKRRGGSRRRTPREWREWIDSRFQGTKLFLFFLSINV